MRIVFVGKEEKGFFAGEVAEKHGWNVEFITPALAIEEQAQKILQCSDCKYVIYDVEQYTDSAEKIADVIHRIQLANNATPIIYASGYDLQSDMIRFLRFHGVQHFIFAAYLDEKKQELERAIQGIPMLDAVEEDQEALETNIMQPTYKSIGIAGVVPRMGTTTQAIQIVKYLLYEGYSACYIELNDHGWVQALAEAYDAVEEDKEIGRVTYQEVDLYWKMEKLPEIMKLNYDYYVYDYGVYQDRDFNKLSFLEKDLQLFMVGTKPGEFMKTYELIDNTFYNRVIYIFNFIPNDPQEREETYELMEEKREDTFFLEDCRDPFRFVPGEFYQKVIPVIPKEKEEKKKKGRSFFRKRK